MKIEAIRELAAAPLRCGDIITLFYDTPDEETYVCRLALGHNGQHEEGDTRWGKS